MNAVTINHEVSSLRGCLRNLRMDQSRRVRVEDEDSLQMLDPFASDEAKILSCKAFRLLDSKTQVLTDRGNPFIRTRLSHVMEVVADSVVVSDILGLNTSLVRAIALGHDIGHVPFGHPGEYFLAKHMGKKEFCHEVLGPLVLQKIERKGKGLNLTFDTLEGMMCHSGNKAHPDMSQEAWVVRFMDKVAYLTADYNDMKRMGYPLPREIHSLMNEFGYTHRERTTTLMCGLLLESCERGHVSFQETEMGHKFVELRRLMNEVYPRVTQQNLAGTIEPILEFLDGLKIGDAYLLFSLMTDTDVKFLSKESTKNIGHLQQTALAERLEYLPDLPNLDICSPYLNW